MRHVEASPQRIRTWPLHRPRRAGGPAYVTVLAEKAIELVGIGSKETSPNDLAPGRVVFVFIKDTNTVVQRHLREPVRDQSFMKGSMGEPHHGARFILNALENRIGPVE
jgi:hypothetical protein